MNRFRLFSFLFFLLVSLPLIGSDIDGKKLKIALIVSLDLNEGKPFFSRQEYDVNDRIKNELKKHFESESTELVVVKSATTEIIWNVLHDRSIYGVIFVGHANTESNSDHPVSSPSIIADHNLYNIKNVFQSVHSNMRLLALVSCNAKGILQNFIENGFYKNAPKLKVLAFDKKIEFKEGIREVLFDEENPLFRHETYSKLYPFGGPCRRFDTQSSEYEECKSKAIHKTKLKIDPSIFDQTFAEPELEKNFFLTRTIPVEADSQNIQPTLVLVNNRVVGLFKTENSRAPQTLGVHLTEFELKEKIYLINDSGAPSTRLKEKIVLGELTLISKYNFCDLKGIKNTHGQLLGVGKNVYQLDCR